MINQVQILKRVDFACGIVICIMSFQKFTQGCAHIHQYWYNEGLNFVRLTLLCVGLTH